MAQWMPPQLAAEYAKIGAGDESKMELLKAIASMTPQSQMVGDHYVPAGLGAAMPLIAALAGSKIGEESQAQKNAFMQENAGKMSDISPKDLLKIASPADVRAYETGQKSLDQIQPLPAKDSWNSRGIPIGPPRLENGLMVQRQKFQDGSEQDVYLGQKAAERAAPTTYSKVPVYNEQTGALVGHNVEGSDGSYKFVALPDMVGAPVIGGQPQRLPSPVPPPGMSGQPGTPPPPAPPPPAGQQADAAVLAQALAETGAPKPPQQAPSMPAQSVAPQNVAPQGAQQVAPQGTDKYLTPAGVPGVYAKVPTATTNRGTPKYPQTINDPVNTGITRGMNEATVYDKVIVPLQEEEDSLRRLGTYLEQVAPLTQQPSFSGPLSGTMQQIAGSLEQLVGGLDEDGKKMLANTDRIEQLTDQQFANLITNSSVGKSLTDADRNALNNALLTINKTQRSQQAIYNALAKAYRGRITEHQKKTQYFDDAYKDYSVVGKSIGAFRLSPYKQIGDVAVGTPPPKTDEAGMPDLTKYPGLKGTVNRLKEFNSR